MDADTTLTSGDQSIQTSPSSFVVGQLLDGKYEILSFLGKGGMGSVYRVKHVHLGVELALKALDATRIGDSNSSRRFQNEGKAAFSLKHPGLVKVHDYGILENGHPFLVMDLVKGKTLQDLIKEHGRLSLSEVESIFVQLCFGLAYAHQQSVVHRDIKPANIMLVDGIPLKDEGSVKVLDFGIAKIVNEDRGEMQTLTATGEVFGSPLYMSPEQCAGGAIDQRSDVYSLGCVLFEALTGTPPLVGANPLRTMMLHASETPPSLKEAALGTEFPQALEHIIVKMLAKTPSDRYADLGIVAHEISKACSGNEYSLQSKTDNARGETSAKVSRPASIKITPGQLKLLIASTAILAVLGTLGFVQLHKAQKSIPKAGLPQEKIAGTNKHDPSNDTQFITSVKDVERLYSDKIERSTAQMKLSFERAAPIRSEVVMEHGLKFQQITFPDIPMGTIDYCSATEQKVLRANGTVTFPVSFLLHLNIKEENDPGILANAFVFDKIDPALFTGLVIHGSRSTMKYQFLGNAPERSQVADLGAKHILDVAREWKNLNFLDLDDLTLSNEMIKLIDAMPKLEVIKLGNVAYNASFFAQQSFFRRIKRFEIEYGEIDDALEAVSNSPTIEYFGVGNNTDFSPAAIRGLNKNRHLKQFLFGAEKLTDADVEAACDLTQISGLAFWKPALNESQIKIILKKWKHSPQSVSKTDDCHIAFARGH